MNRSAVFDFVATELIPELSDYKIVDRSDLINWIQTFGDEIEDNSISERAKVHPTAIINNSIIEAGAEIYEGCVVRNSYIGRNTIIGHCSEIARSAVLSDCMIPRFNYVGSSLIGERVRMGGLVMFATRRHDDQDASIRIANHVFQTQHWKIGSIVGSDTIVGYGCHVNPGYVIGRKVILGSHIDVSFDVPSQKTVRVRQQLDIFDNKLEVE